MSGLAGEAGAFASRGEIARPGGIDRLHRGAVELRPTARAFVRLGVVLLVVAAAAGVWEMLAMQVPSAEYRVGVLPGPIGQVREMSAVLGLACIGLAWLVPFISKEREPWALCIALHAGALITIGALIYGATTGMYGVQIWDPRPDSQALFIVRWTGQGILGLCLLDVVRRVFHRRG